MDDTLRYLPADKVQHRYGCLGFATVTGEGGRVMGRLEGVVLDPSARKLRYVVVKTPGLFTGKHRLLPVDGTIQLDNDAKAIRVRDGASMSACPAVDPAALTPFRDEDLLDALFGRVA